MNLVKSLSRDRVKILKKKKRKKANEKGKKVANKAWVSLAANLLSATGPNAFRIPRENYCETSTDL